jgi:hypothetical protein
MKIPWNDIIIAVTVLFVLIALDSPRLFENNPLDYYSRKPEVLLAVVMAAATMAAAAWAYFLIPRFIRYRIHAVCWGGITVAVILAVGKWLIVELPTKTATFVKEDWHNLLVLEFFSGLFVLYSAWKCRESLRASRIASAAR